MAIEVNQNGVEDRLEGREHQQTDAYYAATNKTNVRICYFDGT